LIVAASSFAASPVRADDLWNTAKDYSAQVHDVDLQAMKMSLRIAELLLESAKADLERAQEEFEDAINSGGTEEAIAAAALAVANAVAVVVKAEAAVAQLAAVVSAATVVSAGTTIGEGADYLISFCWDPICNLDATFPGYVFPDNAEVDSIYQSLMTPLEINGFGASPSELLAHDSVIPGSGSTMLAYARAVVRVSIISLRGAAAFSAGGHCSDVLQAASNLQAAVAELGIAAEDFGHFLATAHTYIDDPQPEIDALSLSLVEVQSRINEFTDSAAVQQAIDSLNAAVSDMENALATLRKPDGTPLPLEGSDGIVPALTLSEFLAFLSDVAINGESALPPT
jgi:hypothetical protein